MGISDHVRSSVQPLQKLPYNVTKKELALLYPQEPEKRLNYFASSVMADNRKKEYKQVCRCRNLLHNEWVKLIEILGYPEGYKKEFE